MKFKREFRVGEASAIAADHGQNVCATSNVLDFPDCFSATKFAPAELAKSKLVRANAARRRFAKVKFASDV